MLFNSFEFIFIFLPFVFFIYFYLNHKKLIELGRVFLVASSLFFYSWWNIVYLPIILLSILFNYILGSLLSNRFKHIDILTKKIILIFGVSINVILLGYFKYMDFFIENINFIFHTNFDLLNLTLPLAISFFTFQQISYLVDSYRGDIKEYNILNYTLFVTFFPQLIAGPIVHHKEMMPQFAKIKNKVINYKNISMGLFIFAIGLFKKVVIADTFAIWANEGFDTATVLSLSEAWATSLSYTFQLYFDFSGYTDMAIGLALLFNIRLPINFNSPYKSTNIQEFWKRWHITLGRFLRDYIYIPLGGNRGGDFKVYSNILIVFIIGGIWHGAGWTFILWGFLHGLALIIHKAWSILNVKLWSWLAWFITFNFINATWVLFRANELEDAIKVWSGMFDLSIQNIEINSLQLAIFILFFIVIFTKNSTSYLTNFNFTLFKSIYIGVLLFLSYIALEVRSSSEFLYFQF